MILATRPVIPRSAIALVGAATAGRRPRNPYLRRDWLRVPQRLAAGMSPREVARAERRDEAAIQGLLAQEGFRELVASREALAAKPPEEQTRQLVVLARQAIYNALADWDVGAAFFVLREDERGRDPAVTLANGVLASRRRAARGSASVPHHPPTRPYPQAALPCRGPRRTRATDWSSAAPCACAGPWQTSSPSARPRPRPLPPNPRHPPASRRPWPPPSVRWR